MPQHERNLETLGYVKEAIKDELNEFIYLKSLPKANLETESRLVV